MPRIVRNVLLIVLFAFTSGLAVTSSASASVKPAHWVERTGLSPDEYQHAFDTFAKGLRLVTVSGYVENGKLRYAALWRKVPNDVAWVAQHGLSAGEYQKAYDGYHKDGYRLVYVTGYEVNGSPLFAGIWEHKSGPAVIARHRLDGDQYQAMVDDLGNKGYRLLHISGYADGGSARYAAIWEHSPGLETAAHFGLSADDYQKTFGDLSNKGYRLKVVSGYSVAGQDLYADIWEKKAGMPWIARNGIPASDYQTVFDVDRYQGYQPQYVQGFSSKGQPRFNVIWESPFSADDLKAINDNLNNALKVAKVAGLSIAIAKNGHLLFASGFGSADKENNIALTANHRLRIGSTSKTTTSVAIFRLIEAGTQIGGGKKLSLDTPVFGNGGILGNKITIPELLKPLKDARIHHFLEHTSGIPFNAGDPVQCSFGDLNKRIEHRLDEIAAIPESSERPVGPVPRAPGAKFDYSNLNFIILEAVIESVSGESYQSYVRKHVFEPSGINAARLFHIGPYDPSTGESKHYQSNGDYAEFAPGNTCDAKPPGVGAGGWAMSAKDLLRFLTKVDGIQPGDILKPTTRDQMLHRPPGLDSRYARGWLTQNWGACASFWNIVQGHNGGLPGAFSNLFFLVDEKGFSFAVIGNQDPSDGFCRPSSNPGEPKPALIACHAIKQPICGDEATARVIDLIRSVDWPDYDLF